MQTTTLSRNTGNDRNADQPMNVVRLHGQDSAAFPRSLLRRVGFATRAGATLFCLLLAGFFCLPVLAQQVETSLPLSQRMTINLAAGVPQYIADATSTSTAPQSNWWYENSQDSTSYSSPTLVEKSDRANWQQVGLPYDSTVKRSFLNQDSGGGAGSIGYANGNWYRLHFKVDSKYAGRKFLLKLEGSHTGVQVFVNGTLLPGISQVAADAQATHVVGFVPVVVDLTPYLHTDGASDNVIAVDVSSGSPWFEMPNFSGAFRFGQGMNGLFRNVYLYVTNPVHIPLNVYSNTKTWGTYVGTVSEVPAVQGTAAAASAVVEVQTNVVNESATAQQVTLTTQIVDAAGNVVVTAPPVTQTLPPMTLASFPSTPTPNFPSQQITLQKPTLWYPNNSTYGKPYLYRVYHIVSVNGVVVDSTTTPLGVRTITWDANFPYFNGHAHYLWGASGRYDYPALGASVPDEQVWRDLAQFAASGGNIWRPGHSSSSEEFVEAADAYGIMIDQPSGDGEGSFRAPSADDDQLKQELHRDMIIRDRSHPSILDWEMDNGGNNLTTSSELNNIGLEWDNINSRKQASRAYSPQYAFLDECDGAGCEVGNKQDNPNNPAFGAEYWDNIGTGRGLAWDYELAFAQGYLNDWRNGRANNSFGMAQWYFADTPGEVSLWAEQRNPDGSPKNPADPDYVAGKYNRSLAYSMVDQNRFPRLLYYIYQANWTPFSIKPVVALAHHWNRAYQYTAGTPIQENAFSNCPSVRLLVNGAAKDPVTGAVLADQVPNPWNIATSNTLNQNTTTMPGQVHWMVNWAPGTVTAECLDQSGNVVPGATDSRITAGTENKIVLTAIPELTKPDGSSFQWTANGSDAAFVVAQVQDAAGNLVPTASDNVTFTVNGPATYMGGTQQVVSLPATTNYYQDAFSQTNSSLFSGLPYLFFHSPGDPELNFEGGLQKIALRSAFTPGTVTVTASAPGLLSGSVQLVSVAPPAPVQSQSPAIIVPPVSTAVTAGYPATFTVAASGSGSLNYQWYSGSNAIAGATGTSYSTPNTTLQDNGRQFSVTVTSTSGYGAVTSNPANLTVSAPANAAITTQPVSQSATVGQAVLFSVAATGSPQLNYQWIQDGVQVANGPQNTFTTPILTSPGTSNVYVVVSNPLNQVKSATAVLTIIAAVPVGIATNPQNQIVPANQPAQLTAIVTGSAPYTYQWSFTPKGGSTTILAGDTTSSTTIAYTVPAMSTATVGAYTLTVNNAANAPATSAAAQLTLAPPGQNLALNRTATSSSSQQTCIDQTTSPPLSGANCLGAENAVDGNLNSRWASQSAGAPPATTVAGIDPSWLQVDLGSVQAFNTVILNWENAYAAQYKIQYTDTDPATNPTWQDMVPIVNGAPATSAVINGAGNTETLNFSTVQARWVRLLATLRATQYGYSLYEFQVYNVAQCGASNERYTIGTVDPNLVLDNLLGLTWTRTIKTNTATGSQFTGIDAAGYCQSIKMRLPTQSEAQSIAGNNNASCAFPGTWNTWTSTVDPNDSSETALVNFDGTSSYKVTNNWPGAVLCAAGTFASQPAAITIQPQAATVTVGQSATFSVSATGSPAPSYQWNLNNAPVAGATAATYITPPTASIDNNSSFTVTVANATNTVISTPVLLTVNAAAAPAPAPTPAPTNPGAGNTNATDTAIPGFGSGPVPTGPNLALNKAPKSSGDENTTVYGPGSALDGNLTSRWSSAFADAEWLQVDLGSVQPVGQVILRWERAYGVKYQILTSTDGVTFGTPVFTQTSGLGGSENITFPAVNARYIRMNGQLRSTAYGYSLWEMEVYGPVAPTIVTAPVAQTATAGAQAQFTVVAGGNGPFTYQWLLNGSSIAGATSATYTTPALAYADNGSKFSVTITNAGGSTTTTPVIVTVNNANPGTANLALYKAAFSSGDESASLGPLNAVDGNLTTRWSSAATDTASITIDLGASMLVNKAVLYWENAYGKAYVLQGSNDEQTWAPLYTQNAGNGGVETLTFPSVVYRYIRLQGVTRASAYGYSLFEFQVFGANVPAIVTGPSGTSVPAGSTATFSVVAGSNGPFTYQWLHNGIVIAGATAATYTTPVVETGDSGSKFTVNVTNVTGTTTPTAAVLTVTSTAPTTPNLALNKPAVDSSSENEANLGAKFANDGNQVTRWSSAALDNSFLTVDLGTASTVNQVILRWENAYGKAYILQVSNDMQTWTPVFTQNSGLGGVENISFVPVSARYVRMQGVTRATAYGYSLFEFEIYGPASTGTAGVVSITTPPTSQSATIGSTATFSVVPGGTGPFTYQWLKGGVAISGATAAIYTTPTLTAADNNTAYSVTVGNTAGTTTVTSTAATLTVGAYTVYPGFLGVDLVNNTGGVWTNDKIYVTVIGIDPATNSYAYLTPAGNVVDFTSADSTASTHVTAPNGQSYGNYSFTLAQSTLLKLPLITSARAYISLGSPLYVPVYADSAGKITGYAGPNPQNGTDPNISTPFDWYELNYGANGTTRTVYVNTTQVDEFGLPLVLDVWAAGGAFHKQVGITESIAQIDKEFAATVPAQFQPTTMSSLRILSPAKLSLGSGGANANYFDSTVATAWANFAKTPVTITLSGRQFTGTASGTVLTFSEVNPTSAYPGRTSETFIIHQPSTQDVLVCGGTMASGVSYVDPNSDPVHYDENNVQLQLQNQICSAINRGILLTPTTNWTNVSAYYASSPSNFYSSFWHNHSIGALAYGFAYDDNNDQSTTITTQQPEHMTFTIGW